MNDSMIDTTVVSPSPDETDNMRARIQRALADIESEHGVSILFACESGSRSYGFASPDSDYDVRFVYVHPPDWYLRVHPERDVIERPINEALDLNGWELRKALGLLHNSNPMLLEWLRSPVMYRQHTGWIRELRELADQYFSCQRSYYHYVSMAKNSRRNRLTGEQVRYKKYFSTLRPLLAARWIREYGSIPPVKFAELVNSLVTGCALLDEINALLKIKTETTGTATGPASRWIQIHNFIERELAKASEWHPKPDTKLGSQALDDYLRRAVRKLSCE